ncbi:MAG: hypothetical protein KDD11_16480 [Acidobacteria bacterium]|nr:hypothetical protein [Acidobacteriota bacterium]
MSPSEAPHEALQQLLAGGRSLPEERFRALLLHLVQDCAECNALLRPFDPGDSFPLFADRASPPARLEDILEHGSAIETTVRISLARQAAFEREEGLAPAALKELLELDASRREQAIRLHERFRTRAVCEALLKEIIRIGFDDPHDAIRLSKLAVFLAAHLDRDFYGRGAVADVAARCWATLANAYRLAADFRTSERVFQRAALLLAVGSGDPLARAGILGLKASLRRDQRRFEAADRLLAVAISTYRSAGETHQVGRTMIKRATLFYDREEPEKAIATLEEAELWIDPEEEPMLEIAARHNRLSILAENDRAEEAQRLLAESEELYRRFDAPWLRAQRLWIEGKISLGLGRPEKAEVLLGEAREFYRERGDIYNWSLISLDLGLIYVESGRTHELHELSESLFTAFQSLDIHREAFAALLLFQRAASADRATAAVVRNLIAAFKRHPYSPAAKPS